MDNELGIGAIIGLLLLLFSGKKKEEEEIIPVNIIPDALPDVDDTDVPSRTDDGVDPPPDEEEKDIGPPLPQIVDPYPRPATFYQVKSGDFGYGIASRFLRSAGFLAAKEIGGLDDAAANDFGKEVAKRVGLQKKVWRAISCNGWNDALVTTYGWKGTSQPLAPTGRVVRLVPQHADNLARLSNGQTPLRNMKWLTPAAKGKGGGVGADSSMRSFEQLWLPGVNLQALWDSDGTVLEFGGGEWGNSGASKKLPPPWVLDLGARYVQGVKPSVDTFGCDGMQWTPDMRVAPKG